MPYPGSGPSTSTRTTTASRPGRVASPDVSARLLADELDHQLVEAPKKASGVIRCFIPGAPWRPRKPGGALTATP